MGVRCFRNRCQRGFILSRSDAGMSVEILTNNCFRRDICLKPRITEKACKRVQIFSLTFFLRSRYVDAGAGGEETA